MKMDRFPEEILDRSEKSILAKFLYSNHELI